MPERPRLVRQKGTFSGRLGSSSGSSRGSGTHSQDSFKPTDWMNNQPRPQPRPRIPCYGCHAGWVTDTNGLLFLTSPAPVRDILTGDVWWQRHEVTVSRWPGDSLSAAGQLPIRRIEHSTVVCVELRTVRVGWESKITARRHSVAWRIADGLVGQPALTAELKTHQRAGLARTAT